MGWVEARALGVLQQVSERTCYIATRTGFGKVMGADTARILVMLATAAMGSEANLAEVAPTLPGAAQASRLAVAEGGVALEAVGAIETVAIGGSALTISLAPGAMAMASASASPGGDPSQVTFSEQGTAGHGARHLVGTGLNREEVEQAIATEVRSVATRGQVGGSFWGRVVVHGQAIEFRAFRLADGRINVGTYYPIP